MRPGKPFLLFIAVLLLSSTFAQKTATMIRGSVYGGARKVPLQEAVITLTSPNGAGSRIVLTDSTGNYVINNLQPGTYNLTFEMEGYKTLGKTNVVVSEGTVVGINIEMMRGKLKDKDRNAEERIIMVSDRKGR